MKEDISTLISWPQVKYTKLYSISRKSWDITAERDDLRPNLGDYIILSDPESQHYGSATIVDKEDYILFLDALKKMC